VSTDLKSIYISHSGELAKYLRRRLPHQHAAPDLVHDAFLRLAEQPMAKIQDARAYLYRVAANLLVDHIRQEKRRRTISVPNEAFADVPEDRASPEETVDSRLRLERLQKLIAQLPFKTQQIFVLNRVDGLSYVEVARVLAISESSVQKHLAMSVRHLARHMTHGR